MPEVSQLCVLTAVGPDRPGLINDICGAVHQAGANLLDSRMAMLGGEFALIVLLSGGADALASVERSRERLERELGVRVLFKPTARPELSGSVRPYRLHVSGIDHPGIVHRVCGAVAAAGVNVASLDSRLAHAPYSGTPIFVLDALLQVPASVAVATLRERVTEACDLEDLDFTLEAST